MWKCRCTWTMLTFLNIFPPYNRGTCMHTYKNIYTAMYIIHIELVFESAISSHQRELNSVCITFRPNFAASFIFNSYHLFNAAGRGVPAAFFLPLYLHHDTDVNEKRQWGHQTA